MKLSDFLTKNYIKANITVDNKDDLLKTLVYLFKGNPKVNDIDKVLEDVYEREKILSTGVGKGFALPHAKTSAVNDILAAFCTLKQPVDYGALDSEPVNIVLMLIGPAEMSSLYLKLMSRISRMISNEDFKTNILKAQSDEELYNLFLEEESNYPEIS